MVEEKTLVVDNHILKTRPGDYKSENYFRAVDCLEDNRRIVMRRAEGRCVTVNDTAWMMRILPYIANYFFVDRDLLLQYWSEDYAVKAMNEIKQINVKLGE